MAIPVTISSLAVHTTYHNIGIWAIISGDDNAATSCTVQYKKVGTDADWKDALPLHYPKRGYSTSSAVSAGATSIPVTAVTVSLASGNTVTFGNGVVATLTASATKGSGSALTVSALSGSIPSGTFGWVDTSPAIRALYGSIPLRDAGSEYLVKLVFTNAGGVTCPASVTTTVNDVAATDSTRTASMATSATVETASGQVVTKSDNVPTPADLLAAVTHYVDASTGNDTTGTGAIGAPWKTIRKALTSAPTGAVVRIAPGHYTLSGQARATGITLVAQYPAIDDDGAVQNDGNHAIVEYGSSTTAGDNTAAVIAANTAAWTSTTLTGPNDGIVRQVWKWTATTVSAPTAGGWASSRDGIPQRLAQWKTSISSAGGSANTAQRWRELIALTPDYHSGFFSTNADVYAVMPDGSDPNLKYWTFGKGVGLSVTGADVRVCGLVMRCFAAAIQVQAAARRFIADHNYFLTNKNHVHLNASAPSTYSRDNLIEYNRMIDTNVWSTVQEADASALKDPACISWTSIKGSSADAYGTCATATTEAQGSAVYATGGGWRNVIRYNYAEGTFNFCSFFGSGYDRYHTAETDEYGNTIRRISDDVFEPETSAINHRYYDNDAELFSVGLSTGPVSYGPLYVMHNRLFRCSAIGVGRNDFENPKVGATVSKHGSDSHPKALIYWVNNTAWTDHDWASDNTSGGAGDHQHHGVEGWSKFASGTLANGREGFYIRNSIIRVTRRILMSGIIDAWDEDYNAISTDPSNGTQHFLELGASQYTTLAAYRAGSTNGDHSDPVGDLILPAAIDALLTDPTNGDDSLKAGTNALVAAGVVVPTISDTQTVAAAAPTRLYEYSGAAPSIGLERDYAAGAPDAGDTTAPQYSAIASVPLANGASVSWTTDEAGDTQVEYGLTTSYGTLTTLKDTTPYTTSHVDLISSLMASTTYHWRPLTRDAAGNLTPGADQTFTTLQPTAPGPVGRTPVSRTPVSRTPVARVAV